MVRLEGETTKGRGCCARAGQSCGTRAGDGKCVFATDHRNSVTGETQANKYSDAFSADALGAAMTAMQNMTDDNGDIMALSPDTIVIPNIASLKKAVFAVVGSEKVPGSGNNDDNYLVGNLEVIVWPQLNAYIGSTNTAHWFPMDSGFNALEAGGVYQYCVAAEITPRSW